MSTDETPRVWIGCLGCYNAGNLIGEWFDAAEAPQDMETFNGTAWAPDATGVNRPGLRLHVLEGHEELWVFDHENFHGLLTGECSPSEAVRLAELIEAIETDGYPVEAFAAWQSNYGPSEIESYDDVSSDFADAYCGEYDSEEHYAQELAEELDLTPHEHQWPASYIDWERATRDLFSGDYWSADAPTGGVYVFRAV